MIALQSDYETAKIGDKIFEARQLDLFLSTYENRIDGKGRVSVPASFRAVLERNRSPFMSINR